MAVMTDLAILLGEGCRRDALMTSRATPDTATAAL